MALSKRVLTAALFAERVVEAVLDLGKLLGPGGNPAYYLKAALHKHELAPLSYGHYGAVLSIPGTDDILKVCASYQDGYPAYAQWAQRNPGPCIPDIFWSVRINEDLFLCAMPRYSELTTDDGHRVYRLRDAGESGESGDTTSLLGAAVYNILEALGDLARKDMHTGNFMYCPKTGQYIVTDPFAELCTEQEVAEGFATTGKRVPKQMRDQVAIDFDAPAREAAASVYKEHRGMFMPRPSSNVFAVNPGFRDIQFNKEFLCDPRL